MEGRTIARALAIGVLALIIALLALAGYFLFGRKAHAAETPPTPSQIAACAPDALRLCPEFIPDHAAVKACMIRHRAQLSAACREAFAK